jgi:hypothetical protein
MDTMDKTEPRRGLPFVSFVSFVSFVVTWLLGAAAAIAVAHSGPPFPILSERTAGPYTVSIWADPDTTDDGSAAGQFWVMLQPADRSIALPARTRAEVTVAPAGRSGADRTGKTEPVNRDAARQFVALPLDHEGRFSVRVSIDGPLGPAAVQTECDATYDMRPAPAMLIVYLMPFVLVGFLWGKQLLQRRRGRTEKTS